MAKDNMKDVLKEIDESNEAYIAAENSAAKESTPSDKAWAEEVISDFEKATEFEDRGLETAVTSGLGTASFSLSDRALIKMGVYTKEELAALRKANPGADIAGTVAGVLGPALLTGGGSAAAQGAAKAATAKTLAKRAAQTAAIPTTAAIKSGQVVEKALSKALGTTTSKSLAKEVVKKSAAKGAGSAVEGAC